MTTPTWPTTAEAWRIAFERGVSISPDEGRRRWRAGELPASEILEWLRVQFDAERGYHKDFVPALERNLRGLLRWAYGDGDEPDWSGSDD